MARYRIQAFGPDGAFTFAASLQCRSEAVAIAKFMSLPLGEVRAELTVGGRLVAWRGEAPPRARPRPPARSRAAAREPAVPAGDAHVK